MKNKTTRIALALALVATMAAAAPTATAEPKLPPTARDMVLKGGYVDAIGYGGPVTNVTVRPVFTKLGYHARLELAWLIMEAYIGTETVVFRDFYNNKPICKFTR